MTTSPRAHRDGEDRGEIEASGVTARRRHRPRVARRRGDEDESRGRRQDVRGALRRGRQHRDDQHLVDPHLVRRPASPTSRPPCARCTPRSSSKSTSADESTGCGSGSIGATGLVGQEMLRCSRSASSRSTGCAVYASARSEGRQLPFAGGEVTCEVLAQGCFDGLDLVIVDVDDPIALEWAPRPRRAGRQGHRQLGRVPHGPRRPARRRRGEPRGPARPAEGHRVVPELHDDGARHRARAAAPRRAASSAWSSRPTSRSRVPGRSASTSSRVSGRSSTAPPSSCAARPPVDGAARAGAVWSKPIAGNVIPLAGLGEGRRLHVGGVEARPREPQDPPRRRDPRHRHLRPRAGVRRARHDARTSSSAGPMTQGRGGRAAAERARRALVDGGDGDPTPLEGAGIDPVLVGRAARGPVATRTRSTSGSPATTSARAPRSTRCRWPRSCSRGSEPPLDRFADETDRRAWCARLRPMASMAVTGAPVALAGVGKRFGRRGAWVLEGVDWEPVPGSITVVQGGNASGKTTLLRIVAGVARASAGRVTRSRATVGFVPERLPTGSG